jgi:hypothetical protein
MPAAAGEAERHCEQRRHAAHRRTHPRVPPGCARSKALCSTCDLESPYAWRLSSVKAGISLLGTFRR